MSFKQKTISGISWSAVANIAFQILQYLTFIILARILTPDDFGLMGMILVFSGFASLFRELGLGAALVQRKEVEEAHLCSVFWLNVTTGVVLSAGMAAAAPAIAAFYSAPRLEPLTILISATFFLKSLNGVHQATLTRRMDFRSLAIINMASMGISGIVGIAMAYSGFGVWSLACQPVVSAAISVVIMWNLNPWRPRMVFSLMAVKDLLGFGGSHLGFLFVNYWVRNGDDLLVGKFLGAASLGLYTRAYGLMLMPLSQVSDTIGQVMFPALSQIQDDKEKVKSIYLRAISLIALVTFPMMLGLLVVSDSFVIALLGDKWEELVPLLKILCLLGMVQSITTTLGWIYLSQGRADLELKWIIAAGVMTLGSIVVGLYIGGLIAVAACYAVMDGLILPYFRILIPGRLIDMSFTDVIGGIYPIFFCATAMAAMVWGIGESLPETSPHWLRLVVQVPFGMAVYLAVIHLARVRAYVDFRSLLGEQWRLRTTGSS